MQFLGVLVWATSIYPLLITPNKQQDNVVSFYWKLGKNGDVSPRAFTTVISPWHINTWCIHPTKFWSCFLQTSKSLLPSWSKLQTRKLQGGRIPQEESQRREACLNDCSSFWAFLMVSIITDKEDRDNSRSTIHLSSLRKSDNSQTFTSQKQLSPYITKIFTLAEALKSHVESSREALTTSTPHLPLPLRATNQYLLKNTATTTSSINWEGNLESERKTIVTDCSIVYKLQDSQQLQSDIQTNEPERTTEWSAVVSDVGNGDGIVDVLQQFDTANVLYQAGTTSVPSREYHGDFLPLTSTVYSEQPLFLQSEVGDTSNIESPYDRPPNTVFVEDWKQNSDASTRIEYQHPESPQPSFDTLFQSVGYNHGSGWIHSSSTSFENNFNDQSATEATLGHTVPSQSSPNSETGLTSSLSQVVLSSGSTCCLSSATQTQTSIRPMHGDFTMENGKKSQVLSKKGVGVVLGSVSGGSAVFFLLFFFHRRCYGYFQRRRRGTILVSHVPENQPVDSNTNLLAPTPECREISYFSADSWEISCGSR